MALVERALQHRAARRLAIGAPAALVVVGPVVEADHAAVHIAVGNQHHAVAVIDVGRVAEPVGRIIATGLVAPAEAADIFAFGRIVHDDMVALAIAAEPDAAGLVDEDAVQAGGPLIDAVDRGGAVGAAPAAQIAAILGEAHHRRGGLAADGGGGRFGKAGVGRGQAVRPMHDPDRIVRADRDAADLTQQQILWHGRPGGIDLEARHLGAGGCDLLEGEGGECLFRWRGGDGHGEGQGEGSGEEGAHGGDSLIVGNGGGGIMPDCPVRSRKVRRIFNAEKDRPTGFCRPVRGQLMSRSPGARAA